MTDKSWVESFADIEWLLKPIRNQVLKTFRELEKGRLELSDPYGDVTLGEDAELSASIRVRNALLYPRILLSGSIGFGEAYADGWWESDDPAKVLELLAINRDRWLNLSSYNPMNLLQWLNHYRNENTPEGSRKNIHEHYDIGNRFYETFLDPTLTYSCAYFEDQSVSLREAQIQKLDRVAQQLNLEPSHNILEIGSGWGSFAVHIAKKYGCEVTTTTISENQYQFLDKLIQREQLQDKVNLLKKDYRNLEGDFDRIVSIEMLEAVGEKYLSTFFGQLESLLKPDGEIFLQTIHIQDQFYERYRNTVDFIQRYVFPGGHLPSLVKLLDLITGTNLGVKGIEEIGEHYARTLLEWKKRFHSSKEKLSDMEYDEQFLRMWEYYFNYCEAGFRSGLLGNAQLRLKRQELLK